MASEPLEEFLEMLDSEAKTGEAVLAVERYVSDATVCHGFGAPCRPYDSSRKILGILKSGIVFGQSLRPDKSGRVALADIFEKFAVEGDGGKFVVASGGIGFLQNPALKLELNVVRIQNAEEVERDTMRKGMIFHNRVFGTGLTNWNLFGGGVSEETYGSMALNREITLYVGQEAVVDYLGKTKKASNLTKAFVAVGIPLSVKIVQEAAREAKEEVMEIYKTVVSLADKEKEAESRLDALRRTAEGPGIVVEKGAVAVVEDADDMVVMTLGRNEEFRREYDALSSRVKEAREKEVTRFVKKIEIYPGVVIGVEKFLSSLENTLKQKEGQKEKLRS